MTAILVADGSQTVRMDLADTFEAGGFRVFSCATTSEARATLRSQPIALAVIDPAMNGGDGHGLIQQIRAEHVLCELPVLVLARTIDVPDVECVGKPYDRAHLIARARELVGAPPLRDSILLITADPIDDLAGMLARVGFAIEVASSGVAGWEAAIRARPTAIIMAATRDIDRASLVKRLRLEPGLRTTPVLAVGAATEEVSALEAGADGFVRLGDSELVLARLRALLRGSLGASTEGINSALQCVLAVDDDSDYLDILGSRLRKRGYDVVSATSGEQALAILGQRAVDCVVLDRSMPGLSGVATCERIKTGTARETPVIFLTATERREAVIESLAAGADDFVSKAAGFDALAARIQAQIRRRHVEAEQREARDKVLRAELAMLEAKAATELAQSRAQTAEHLTHANRELVTINRELEEFSYTVAHDLRAPLRTIGIYAHSIRARSHDDSTLDHVRRILAAATRMSEVIESLLELARSQHEAVARHSVDLTALATAVVDDLARREPGRCVEHAIADHLTVDADGRLVRVLLENLMANAWRFTIRKPVAHVEVGVERSGGQRVFYVKDDGDGFDMAHVHRLFDSGIGLRTARKIVERHGGRIWAEGAPGAGAKFSFTLP